MYIEVVENKMQAIGGVNATFILSGELPMMLNSKAKLVGYGDVSSQNRDKTINAITKSILQKNEEQAKANRDDTIINSGQIKLVGAVYSALYSRIPIKK